MHPQLDAILYDTEDYTAARCQGEHEASTTPLNEARERIGYTWGEARVLAEQGRNEEAAYVAGWAMGYQNVIDGVLDNADQEGFCNVCDTDLWHSPPIDDTGRCGFCSQAGMEG